MFKFVSSLFNKKDISTEVELSPAQINYFNNINYSENSEQLHSSLVRFLTLQMSPREFADVLSSSFFFRYSAEDLSCAVSGLLSEMIMQNNIRKAFSEGEPSYAESLELDFNDLHQARKKLVSAIDKRLLTIDEISNCSPLKFFVDFSLVSDLSFKMRECDSFLGVNDRKFKELSKLSKKKSAYYEALAKALYADYHYLFNAFDFKDEVLRKRFSVSICIKLSSLFGCSLSDNSSESGIRNDYVSYTLSLITPEALRINSEREAA